MKKPTINSELFFCLGFYAYILLSTVSLAVLSSWEMRIEGSPLSRSLQLIAVAAFFSVSIFSLKLEKYKEITRNLPTILISIFVIFIITSTAWSSEKATSFTQSIAVALFFLIIYARFNPNSAAQSKTMLYSGITIYTIIIICFFIHPINNDRTLGGIQPNQLAKLSLTGLILILLSASKVRTELLFGLFTFAIIIFTESRGGLLYLLAGSFAMATLLAKRRISRSKLIAIILISTFFFILAATSFFSEKISTLFIEKLAIEDPDRGLGSGLSGRTDHWAAGFTYFFDSPLFGSGFKVAQTLVTAHSGYINLLIDIGLLGFTLFILAFTTKCRSLLRNYRLSKDRTAAIILSSLICSVFVWTLDPLYMNLGNSFSFILLASFFFNATRSKTL